MKLIVTSLFFLLTFSLVAQITVTSATFPAPGDTLRTATNVFPSGIDITAPGGDQSWDFSNLTVQQTPFLSVYAGTAGTGADTIAPLANVTSAEVTGAGTAYYLSDDDEFSLLAIAGDGSTVDSTFAGIAFQTQFQPRFVERHGDLNFFDNFTFQSNSLVAFSTGDLPDSIIAQIPILPDSLRIRIQIDRNDLVDGWGTLAVPGNSYSVLREKRTETRTTVVEALVPFFGWTDITGQLPAVFQDFVAPSTTVSYYFWNDVEKEFIARVVLQEDSDTEVERIQYKWHQNAVQTREPEVALLDAAVFPNPASEVLSVRVNFEEPTTSVLSLIDARGRVIRTERNGATPALQVTLDVNELPAGMYFVRLTDDRGRLFFSRGVTVRGR